MAGYTCNLDGTENMPLLYLCGQVTWFGTVRGGGEVWATGKPKFPPAIYVSLNSANCKHRGHIRHFDEISNFDK